MWKKRQEATHDKRPGDCGDKRVGASPCHALTPLDVPGQPYCSHDNCQEEPQRKAGCADSDHAIFLKVDMGTDAEHRNGAAILVIAGMGDKLNVKGGVEAPTVVSSVVGFDDVLTSVVQMTVAEQEA